MSYKIPKNQDEAKELLVGRGIRSNLKKYDLLLYGLSICSNVEFELILLSWEKLYIYYARGETLNSSHDLTLLLEKSWNFSLEYRHVKFFRI